MRVEFKRDASPENGLRVRDLKVGQPFVFVSGAPGHVYLRAKSMCYVELGSGDLFHVDEAKGLVRLVDATVVVQERRVAP